MGARLVLVAFVLGGLLFAPIGLSESKAGEVDCEKVVAAWSEDKTGDSPPVGVKGEDFQKTLALMTEQQLKRHPNLLKCLEAGCAKKSGDHCFALSVIEGLRGNRERALEVGRVACRLRHSEAECKRAEAINTENLRAAQESLRHIDESLKKMDDMIADEEKKCRDGNCSMCQDVGGFHQGGSAPEDKLKAKELYQIGCKHGCASSCERLAKLN